MDQATRAAIRELAEGRADWPLYLHGPAGVGKTCAALCLLDHTAGDCHYFTLPRLCWQVVEAMHGRLENSAGYKISVEKFWSRIEQAALVVVDEIASRDRVSDHVYECVWSVLDLRHRKPLVMISNLGPERIESLFDDRVVSRLCAGTVLPLIGQDRRLQRPRLHDPQKGVTP